ncbi:hypothetical protein CY35_13G108000 [Sphagnum magellanicum]|nr:hypothetical protein CY35_13G108000 [Sphagnum magellanicum]
MAQDQIEIITVNDGNSAEIDEPAGAAVGEAFNAHERSNEADSGSQPPNPNYTIDVQEVQAGESEMTDAEKRIRTLAKVKELEPTKNNLWKVAYEHFSERLTICKNRIYKREEEMRIINNEIYQVVGFFSAFQGLLITAAAQSNLLHCNNVGFILALSAFATAVALFGICHKITAMVFLRLINEGTNRDVKQLSRSIIDLQLRGINFDFRFFEKRQSNLSSTSLNLFKLFWYVHFGILLVGSVIAFGGLCMVAMRQIVCNPGHSLPSN